MKKKVIKAQSTIAKTSSKKQFTRVVPDDSWKYKYKFYSNPHNVTDAALEVLAENMIEWINTNQDAILFGEFLYAHKISRASMALFLERSEKLRKAKEFTMYMIGVNREKGALKKELDYNTVKARQYQYDPDWGIAEERAFKLKSSLEDAVLTKEDFNEALLKILKPVATDDKNKTE